MSLPSEKILHCAVFPSELQVVYGVPEILPISNLPPGARVKLRLRAGCVAVAVVKHGGSVVSWLLFKDGAGAWMLKYKTGENHRPASGGEEGAAA